MHQAFITGAKHPDACAFAVRLLHMCHMLSEICRKSSLPSHQTHLRILTPALTYEQSATWLSDIMLHASQPVVQHIGIMFNCCCECLHSRSTCCATLRHDTQAAVVSACTVVQHEKPCDEYALKTLLTLWVSNLHGFTWPRICNCAATVKSVSAAHHTSVDYRLHRQMH